MSDFHFDADTVLYRIWEQYPWLSEVLPRIDSRFAVMNTAAGKLLMKTRRVRDLSRLSGLSTEELLAGLREEIARHESGEAEEGRS